MITAQNNKAGFEPVPAGAYVARCIEMIHIGTITEDYMGSPKTMNKVRISFELPTETKVFKEEKGAEPYVIGKDFTLSMNEKSTLRKFLESWRGKGFTDEETKSFDISKLLGVACMINVIHKETQKGRKYADIASITPMVKGMECPNQVNSSFEFSYEPFSQEKFNKLPDWLQKKIAQSDEYKALNRVEAALPEQEEQDLPF